MPDPEDPVGAAERAPFEAERTHREEALNALVA